VVLPKYVVHLQYVVTHIVCCPSLVCCTSLIRRPYLACCHFPVCYVVALQQRAWRSEVGRPHRAPDWGGGAKWAQIHVLCARELAKLCASVQNLAHLVPPQPGAYNLLFARAQILDHLVPPQPIANNLLCAHKKFLAHMAPPPPVRHP